MRSTSPIRVLSTLEEVEKRAFLHAGLGRDTRKPHGQARMIGDGASRSWRWTAARSNFMYAADAEDNRPRTPGGQSAGCPRSSRSTRTAFDQIPGYSRQGWVHRYRSHNDSQPDDPPRPPRNPKSASRVRSSRDRKGSDRSVKIDEADLARNLASIAATAADGSLVIAYLTILPLGVRLVSGPRLGEWRCQNDASMRVLICS